LSLTLILFGAVVVVVLSLLALALRSPAEPGPQASFPCLMEGTGRPHVELLPQIRQALAQEDQEYLSRMGAGDLRRRLDKERRRIALSYLKALRGDFESLLRIARIIAALSPETGVGQELERLKLTAIFLWKYSIVQLALRLGGAPLRGVLALSNHISGLSVRLEATLKAMGERAAQAGEMISPSDRGRVHFS